MLWRIYSFWTIRIRGPRTKVSGPCVTYADQAVRGSLIRILFMIRHQCVQSLWIQGKEIYFLILKVRCKCFSLVDSMAKALTNGKSIASNSQYECGTPWKRVSHSYLVLLYMQTFRYNVHPSRGIVPMPPLPFSFNRGLCFSALPTQVRDPRSVLFFKNLTSRLPGPFIHVDQFFGPWISDPSLTLFITG